MSGITMPAIADPAAAAKSYMALGARPTIDAKRAGARAGGRVRGGVPQQHVQPDVHRIDGDGPFGGGGKAGVWRSFLTEEYSKSFAKAGGIGIADHVYRSLLNQQEVRAR